MDTIYTLREVAELLGEPLYSIRNWRRLPDTHPRHLPTLPDHAGHHQISAANLTRWLKRNPDMAERVLSLFAPVSLRLALRDTPAADTTDTPIDRQVDYGWWLSHGAAQQSDQSRQDNHPQGQSI